MSGIRCLELDGWNWVFGEYLELGRWKLGLWNLVVGTRSLELDRWNSIVGTGCLELGVWNWVFGTQRLETKDVTRS